MYNICKVLKLSEPNGPRHLSLSPSQRLIAKGVKFQGRLWSFFSQGSIFLKRFFLFLPYLGKQQVSFRYALFEFLYRILTQTAWVQIWVQPLTSCVTLGKLLCLGFIICECSSLPELLRGLNELKHKGPRMIPEEQQVLYECLLLSWTFSL